MNIRDHFKNTHLSKYLLLIYNSAEFQSNISYSFYCSYVNLIMLTKSSNDEKK